MRNISFYPRLALVNLLRNGQFYLPYLLSAGGISAMFYIVDYLSRSEMVYSVRGAEYLLSFMTLGTIIAGIFSVILMIYANRFVMKRRRRELGLYNVLGMEKRHIAKLMFCETLICAAVSISAGLVFGILFSKLVLVILFQIAHLPVLYGFEISVTAIVHTAVLFGALFLATLLLNLISMGRARPVELLHSADAGEREPKANWLIALIGTVTLLGGYYIALTVKDPIEAMLFFFVAVLLVILGTYCLFTAGSISALKILRKNKKYYYHPRHFTAISGMLYRMKQNAMGLANICILSTMVLVTISTTLSLYVGLGRMVDERYPADFTFFTHTTRTEENPDNLSAAELLQAIESKAAEHNCTLESVRYGSLTRFRTCFSDDVVSSGEEQDSIFAEVLTAEEYGRISGETVTLEQDEILLYVGVDRMESEKRNYDALTIGGETYRVAEELELYRGMNHGSTLGIIVLNADTAQRIVEQCAVPDSTPLGYFGAYIDVEGSDEDKKAFAADISNLNDGSCDDRETAQMEFYAIYGGFLFIGLFLGTVFLSAAVLIIYYKQISEGYEDHRRFAIMQQVGMSLKEVRATINTQILLVFFLPLIVAAVHISAAFPMIQKMLLLFDLTDVRMFALCMLGTLLVFSAIYAVVYSLTAKTYYKIVRQTV